MGIVWSGSVSSVLKSVSDSREVTWGNFCWVCAAGISDPLPHSLFLVYFVAGNRPHLSHFFGHCSLFLVYFSASYRPSF